LDTIVPRILRFARTTYEVDIPTMKSTGRESCARVVREADVLRFDALCCDLARNPSSGSSAASEEFMLRMGVRCMFTL
jgi:hypothetical protein